MRLAWKHLSHGWFDFFFKILSLKRKIGKMTNGRQEKWMMFSDGRNLFPSMYVQRDQIVPLI